MIIWINGSINSGKTTIAKLLRNKFKKAAVIEIDELRNFIESTTLADAISINLESAVLLTKNFIDHEYDVIIPYPLSESNAKYIREKFSEYDNNFFIFSLSPSLETALKNRGSRELTEWEIERIKYHYEIGIPQLSGSIIIDNSEESPEQTVEKISSYLQF